MADAAAAGSKIVGTGLAIAGPLIQGQQEKSLADYNASVAYQNEATVKAQGEENARQSLVQTSKLIGSDAAAFGGQGGFGVSAQAVLRNSAAQGELSSLTIKNNADIKAAGFANEGALQTYRGNAAELAGYMKALSAGIKGATGGSSSGDGSGGSELGSSGGTGGIDSSLNADGSVAAAGAGG